MPCVSQEDPFDLIRFVEAQAKDYKRALAELQAGKKQTHWIWYVLPQLRGLGSSSRAIYYGIRSMHEAAAYLAHPILGPRLRECVATTNSLGDRSAVQILGEVDATKFWSCLTLFCAVDPKDPAFREALDKFFAGASCKRSLNLMDLLRHEA
ncbi:MAG: DUF1810 domain-containing protein [Betaproteobacteria bacterium]